VARPANPADPNALRPNAPILPSAMLTDRAELEKHLSKSEFFSSIEEDLIEPPPPLVQQQQHQQHLVDQTTSPIRGDEYVAR
jgi:hypothetical protein